MEVINKRYDLWVVGSDRFRIVTKTPYLAAQLNRILGRYPRDYQFTFKDEPIFFFNGSQVQYIVDEVPLIGQISFLQKYLVLITKEAK